MLRLRATSHWLLPAIALAMGSTTAVSQQSKVGDSEIESCLLKGKILRGQESVKGVTRPIKVQIECDGETRSALFKSIDEHRRGFSRFADGGVEMNFSDDFRYERAAYLLDRELGLNMIPVAVLRARRGKDGALINWVENASHENEMPGRPTGPQLAELARQKELMYLFDALIDNIDRRSPNWLIGNDNWNLYLIDHSRSFRTDNKLNEEYLDRRARLTKNLYQQLQDLDEEGLKQLLKGLVTSPQIQAIIARRDEIIAKIDRDRQDYGDQVVFSD